MTLKKKKIQLVRSSNFIIQHKHVFGHAEIMNLLKWLSAFPWLFTNSLKKNYLTEIVNFIQVVIKIVEVVCVCIYTHMHTHTHIRLE